MSELTKTRIAIGIVIVNPHNDNLQHVLRSDGHLWTVDERFPISIFDCSEDIPGNDMPSDILIAGKVYPIQYLYMSARDVLDLMKGTLP